MATGTVALTMTRIAGASVARQARATLRASRLRRRTTLPPTGFDPSDLADPYPRYGQLLDGPPIAFNAERDICVVSHYDAVRAAARAHGALSSAEGVIRIRSGRVPMLITMDRPNHSRLRKLVAHDFTRDALERWRAEISELAVEAVDAMLADRETDAVARLAAPLPVKVIARMLGIPASDFGRFRRWSDRLVVGMRFGHGWDPIATQVDVLRAAAALHAYFRRELARRQDDPGDDVLGRLLAPSRGERVSEEEFVWFALMLLVAGNETTTSLLGTMLLTYAREPDQYARLRADPALIPSAVEESLRFVSPIQGLYRTAIEDYEGIPRGARVLLLFGAANRDPRQYADPDRFDVARNPTDHLGFGSGIHFCLGAHLARLEATVVLGELVRRVGAIELAGAPAWIENPSIRGLSRLPLRVA